MGTTDDRDRKGLAAYFAILRHRDVAGHPFVIVGGQAVNFWAELYLARESRLSVHLPFTSKDLDLVGTRSDAERVAKMEGWTVSPPSVGGGPVEAILSTGPGERGLRVEFLREIKGVSAQSIAEYARETSLRNAEANEAVVVRVLDPVLLLFGKLRNAVDIEQDVPERPRQDVKHVAMLAWCVPHFLEDLRSQAVDRSASREVSRRYIAMLAALRNTYSGRMFESRYPGVVAWEGLVPPSIRNLGWDTEVRRSLSQLDGASQSRGIGI